MTHNMHVLEVILIQLAGYGNIFMDVIKVDSVRANIDANLICK